MVEVVENIFAMNKGNARIFCYLHKLPWELLAFLRKNGSR